MRRIQFTGFVRLANRVHRALSMPITAEQLARLEREVRNAVERMDSTLRSRGMSLRAVPGPTRRAYGFMREIRFDQVPVVAESGPHSPLTQTVSLSGIVGRVERHADELARAIATVSYPAGLIEIQRIEKLIQRDTERANRSCARMQGIPRLSPRTREHLSWLRHMSDADNVRVYCDALLLAATSFERVADPERWPRPIVVHFRPSRSVFRLRVQINRLAATTARTTRILLPTPMVAVSVNDFDLLGRAMFRRNDRRRNSALHSILMSEPFQTLQAELDSLVPADDETRGIVHDLSESFARVNAQYFFGAMPRPHLTWNHAITAGKFGHYNYSTDTVMISRALDRPPIPTFVVDHVMHHELLHKKHGVQWKNGRGHAHTAEFRQEERRFERFEEADQFLQRLANPSSASSAPIPRRQASARSLD